MAKGKLQFIIDVNADATNPIGDGPKIIAHVCNNANKFGAGFAYAVAKKWTYVKESYHKFIAAYKKQGLDTLGYVDIAEVHSTPGKEIFVANMIAMDDVYSVDNPHPLKYEALVICMKLVKLDAEINKASIHAPVFGAGLAKGNWDFIQELIREIWIDNGINVTIYVRPQDGIMPTNLITE